MVHLENSTAALFLEGVIILFGKTVDKHVIVLVGVTELHDLCNALGHGQSLDSCLSAELFHQIPLGLKVLLKLVTAHPIGTGPLKGG